MTNQKVIFRATTSGRAFEKIHRPDGSYVLVADKATHERALQAAGAKLRQVISENRGETAVNAAAGRVGSARR